jgi:hypothetical protein
MRDDDALLARHTVSVGLGPGVQSLVQRRMVARAHCHGVQDRLCNLRDILVSPPADWPVQRKRDYFDWAAQVVDQLRGTHPVLEAAFDQARARATELI